MKIKAYGKVNISLDVVGKREDGYHLLSMIMQNIDLYDEIDVEELMAADNSKSSENAKKENSTPKAVVNQKSEAETNPIKYFNEHIELRVAKIEKVDVNPEGDKLYIETMDDGSGTPRIIQSGLRPYLKAEELAAIARTHGLCGMTCGSVGKAYETARKEALPNDIIYIGGSSFVVADLLSDCNL